MKSSRSLPTPKKKRWRRYVKLAAELGGILLSLRDKPGKLDLLSVAFRAGELALAAREEHQKLQDKNAWDYFAGQGWISLHSKYKKLVTDQVCDVEAVKGYGSEDEEGKFRIVCRGFIDGETFAWIVGSDDHLEGIHIHIRTSRKAESYAALGKGLWKEYDSNRLVCAPGGFYVDRAEDEDIVATGQMNQVLGRVRSFLEQDINRSYLLFGPPGSGKSCLVRWLVTELGLSSLRVDLSVLVKAHFEDVDDITSDLEAMLYLLRPEVMILDDVDRQTVTPQLLAFLELAQRTCRVVIGSANSLQKITGATTRPGRFDEIIKVDKLDWQVLASLIGMPRDPALEKLLTGLPIAYVVEVLKRKKVLGREVALDELGELRARAEETSRDS